MIVILGDADVASSSLAEARSFLAVVSLKLSL
jgi:hypothetical protein